MQVTTRNISIDVLKFLAVLCITNSHFDIMYTHLPSLATGGAIGDALFFFCSGFTILLGRFGRFDNWYKRRIRRIYPSVFGWAIVAAFFFGSCNSLKITILRGGGWFISAIMIYYVMLFFVRRFLAQKLWVAFAAAGVLLLAWYIVFFDHKEMNHLYKNGQYYIYFIFMLQGAILGVRSAPRCKPLCDALRLVGCIVLFYGLQIVGERYPVVSLCQIITIIPLLGIIYYMYKLANTKAIAMLYHNKICGWFIMFLSGLCLEVYLCQFAVITNKLNGIFPLNLLIVFLGIITLAYLVRCVARCFAQTFDKDDYDWRQIFSLIDNR